MKYDVTAVRYATRDGDRKSHFVHESSSAPMPMDYFIWVVAGPERTIVVDTGFTKLKSKGRTFLYEQVESLRRLGIDAGAVSDVVLTHLHYDHAGGTELFPNARLHVQEREMAHVTGRYMRPTCALGHGYVCEDVLWLVRKNFEGQVVFYSGDAQIAPGVSVHLIGGHTPGLQCVRVSDSEDDDAAIVLASDSVHFYEQIDEGKVFSTVYHVEDMLDGYDKLRRLAGPHGVIVPGHDPEVLRRFPAARSDMQGIAARIQRGH